MGLLMKHTVRPPVTSYDLREQIYLISLTSYGHLSIFATKKNQSIYIALIFLPVVSSIDLWCLESSHKANINI